MSVLANFPATPCIISWPFSNNQICTAFAAVHTFEEFSKASTEYAHVLNHLGFGFSSRRSRTWTSPRLPNRAEVHGHRAALYLINFC
jgi:hypothetical protein